MEHEICTSRLQDAINRLKAGDRIYLSGSVYTARDAAHKRLVESLNSHQRLPIPLKGSVIFYVGPTPHFSYPVGAAGPTTSSRMDPYTPRLLDLGVLATIGKGERAPYVVEAIRRNQAVYFSAIGGAGALASRHIIECKEIAFQDLGCESIKELTLDAFPLIVAVDCRGKSIFWNAASQDAKGVI